MMEWCPTRRNLVRTALGIAGGAAIADSVVIEKIGLVEAQTIALRKLADRKGFHIGGAELPLDDASANDFNVDEATAGYMKYVCPFSPDKKNWNYMSIDHTLQNAKANSQQAGVLHLVWGYNGLDNPRLPAWVPAEVESNGGNPMPTIERYIEDIVSHVRDMFPNTVRWFTAVNEPLNNMGGFDDFQLQSWPSPWTNYFNNASAQYFGDPRTYITESFKTALRETRPQGKQTNQTFLLINEWHAEQPGTPKGEAYLNLVEYLADQGIPMERIGVGFQMHLWPGKQGYENGLFLRDSDKITQFANNFRDHAKRFPAGPYITEMDIDTSGWSQLGYSWDQIVELSGEAFYSITKALIDAGGRTLISFMPLQLTGPRNNPEGNLKSPRSQIMKAIGELPDQ